MNPPDPIPSRLPPYPPAWAEEFGEDKYGLFAMFKLESVPFVFRWIPPGSFLMGSSEPEVGRDSDEGPQHEVVISKGFWLGETPVTQVQWEIVARLWVNAIGVKAVSANTSSIMRSYPSQHGGTAKRQLNPNRIPDLHELGLPLDDDSSHHPVEQISWLECTKFATQLSGGWALQNLAVGSPVRIPKFMLPSEAQWEYACRAGTLGAFGDGSACTEPSGKDPALDRLGWFDENSGRTSHPVKGKACNGWGLYDMHGNVWEWCRDGKREYQARTEVDPVGPEEEDSWRVVRGGSWGNFAGGCRAAFRHGDGPDYRGSYLGFRLAAGQEMEERE